jgi:hypothetical protein
MLCRFLALVALIAGASPAFGQANDFAATAVKQHWLAVAKACLYGGVPTISTGPMQMAGLFIRADLHEMTAEEKLVAANIVASMQSEYGNEADIGKCNAMPSVLSEYFPSIDWRGPNLQPYSYTSAELDTLLPMAAHMANEIVLWNCATVSSYMPRTRRDEMVAAWQAFIDGRIRNRTDFRLEAYDAFFNNMESVTRRSNEFEYCAYALRELAPVLKPFGMGF